MSLTIHQINEELERVSFSCGSLKAHAAKALLSSGLAFSVAGYDKKLLNDQLVVQLFHHVGHGNLDEAKKILAVSPELILARAEITDIAGNSFYIVEDEKEQFLTIAQYVWWARDRHMMKMINITADSSGQISAISSQINQLKTNSICRIDLDGSMHIEKYFSFDPIIQAYGSLYHLHPLMSIARAPLAREQMKLPAWIRMELCSHASNKAFRETERSLRSLKFFDARTGKEYRWDNRTELCWNKIIANDDSQTAVAANTLTSRIGYVQFMKDRERFEQMKEISIMYFNWLSKIYLEIDSACTTEFSWSDFSSKSACAIS